MPSQSDQRKILESVGELLLQMQKASQGSVPSPSSINVKVTKNEQGWCSDSANRLTGTMVGCSEIGNGRFIVANYFEEQSTKDPDTLKKRAMNYFDLILSKISAIR